MPNMIVIRRIVVNGIASETVPPSEKIIITENGIELTTENGIEFVTE